MVQQCCQLKSPSLRAGSRTRLSPPIPVSFRLCDRGGAGCAASLSAGFLSFIHSAGASETPLFAIFAGETESFGFLLVCIGSSSSETLSQHCYNSVAAEKLCTRVPSLDRWSATRLDHFLNSIQHRDTLVDAFPVKNTDIPAPAIRKGFLQSGAPCLGFTRPLKKPLRGGPIARI